MRTGRHSPPLLGLLIPAVLAGTIAMCQGAIANPFLLGADISTLSQVEGRGGVFRDHGEAGDAIALFRRHGWNCFRLRLFVQPDGRGGVINTLAYTRALAKRIKAAGGTFILDIHYSDTWADPQHQVKPTAWAAMDFDALERTVETYTANVIRSFKDGGILPDIVQVGNEITGGTLWPDAQVRVPPSSVKVFEGDVKVIEPPQPYDDVKQWDRLTRIIKAGIRGVRSAEPDPHRVRTMIHIDCGGDWPVTRWYLDQLRDHGVEYDLIGQSYYPNWHGTLDNLRDNLRQTAARYDKDIMVVETAYPARYPEYWSKRKNMAWPVTPDGQAAFMADLIRTVRETPGGHGAGVVYWHPEGIRLRDDAGHLQDADAMSLFADDGEALPAVRVLDRPEPPGH